MIAAIDRKDTVIENVLRTITENDILPQDEFKSIFD